MKRLSPVNFAGVRFLPGFWHDRTATNREVTLPIQFRQLKDTGRIDSLRLEWKPGEKNKPHEFWDSDIGKWIEAASYALACGADERLQGQLDETIELLKSSQQPDGYLNTHFTTVRPAERWTNLRDAHELYCAGHLLEAAVAHFQATGDRKLLDVMSRYVDYIDATFGREEGKNRGYCGHPEIELALMRLYAVTGDPRHLKLAKYFIDERGQAPNYFDCEAVARGQNPRRNWAELEYYQADVPIRQQRDINGHAVRALYLLSGMIDLAAETDDQELLDVSRRWFESATRRRMYLTGGVGSDRRAERFTFDYDLPNETAYAETCAAIALVFAAHRLLEVDPRREYADVMERALFNGVISGVSLAGDRFFYANPLTVHRETLEQKPRSHVSARRHEWFGCACCPPNLARLLASLGTYFYSTGDDAIWVHLYGANEAALELGGQTISITQQTDYPWDGRVKLTIVPTEPAKFTLLLRLPAWCEKPSFKVNGRRIGLKKTKRGYAQIRRKWSPGDRVTLKLPMPPRLMETNPRSRNNIGKLAIVRGPVVYCVEEIDNGKDLAAISIRREAKLREKFEPHLLGGVVVITAKARRRHPKDFGDDLYRSADRRHKTRSAAIKAVPYCVWANREAGEMRVWLTGN